MAKVTSNDPNRVKRNIYSWISSFLRLVAILLFVFLIYYISCIFMNDNKSSAGKTIKTGDFFDFNGLLKDITTIETVQDALKDFDKITGIDKTK